MFRDIFKKADRKTQGRDAEQRLEKKTGRRGMRKFALHFLACGLVLGAMAALTPATDVTAASIGTIEITKKLVDKEGKEIGTQQALTNGTAYYQVEFTFPDLSTYNLNAYKTPLTEGRGNIFKKDYYNSNLIVAIKDTMRNTDLSASGVKMTIEDIAYKGSDRKADGVDASSYSRTFSVYSIKRSKDNVRVFANNRETIEKVGTVGDEKVDSNSRNNIIEGGSVENYDNYTAFARLSEGSPKRIEESDTDEAHNRYRYENNFEFVFDLAKMREYGFDGKKITITYNVTLTNDSMWKNGNVDESTQMELWYSDSGKGEPEKVIRKKVILYTYGIDLNIGDALKNKLSSFALYEANGDELGTQITFISDNVDKPGKEEPSPDDDDYTVPGQYYVDMSSTDGKTAEIAPSEDGVLQLYGLGTGTYYLVSQDSAADAITLKIQIKNDGKGEDLQLSPSASTAYITYGNTFDPDNAFELKREQSDTPYQELNDADGKGNKHHNYKRQSLKLVLPDPPTATLTGEKQIDATKITGSEKKFKFTLTAEGGAPMPEGAADTDGEGNITYTVENTNGDIVFPKITFPTKNATYTYKITETGDYAPDYVKDKNVYTATVKVSYNDKDYKWQTEVSYKTEEGSTSSDKFVFNNLSTGKLQIKKQLEGSFTEADRDFTFQVDLKDGATSLAGSYRYQYDDGSWSDTISDGGTLKLRGGQSVTIVGLPPQTTYKVTELEENQSGYATTSENASGTIEGQKTKTVTFTNKRNVVFVGTKLLDGRTPTADEKFCFVLTPKTEAAPMPTASGDLDKDDSTYTVENSGSDIVFPEIQFTNPGQYNYEISEQDIEGYLADKNKVEVRVTVYTAGENVSANVQYKKGTESSWHDTFTMNNYSVGTLSIQKTVEGSGAPSDAEFNFMVQFFSVPEDVKGPFAYTIGMESGEIPADGGTITLKADQTAEIRGIPANARYIVSEELPDQTETGFKLTSPQYNFLTGKIEKNTTAAAGFTNTYTAPTEAAAVISAQKYVDNGVPLSGDVFEFELSPLDGAPMPTGETTYTAQNEGTQIFFPEITYTEAGTYYYTIREKASATAGFAATDNTVVYAKVDVTKNNWQLKAAVSYAKEQVSGMQPGDELFSALPIAFYNVSTGSLAISKNVQGNGADKGQNFTFTLKLNDAAGHPLSGTYSYEKETFAEDGTPVDTAENKGEISNDGTFTLKHGQKMTVILPTQTRYEVVETPASGYSTTKSGDRGVIVRDTITSASFVNEKDTVANESSIHGFKKVDGEDAAAADEFEFVLTADTATTPMPAGATNTGSRPVCTVENTNGVINFGTVTYTRAGVYTYTIHEKEKTGFITDPDEVTVIARVEDTNSDGVLETNISYIKDGVTSDTFTFYNYSENELQISKAVTGAGESQNSKAFEFEVTLDLPEGIHGPFAYTVSGVSEGQQIQGNGDKLTLKAGQTATITGLPAGTNYTVKEVNIPRGFEPVADTLNGMISRSEEAKAAFTNTYTPLPATVTPVVTKKLEVIGSDRRLNDEEFSFTMSWKGTAPDGAVLPDNKTAKNDAKGAVTFDAIQFTKAGSYTVEIKEDVPENKIPGITYSTETVEITYTVTDNDGQLEVEADPKVGTDASTITNIYQPASVKSEVPPVTKILNGKTLNADEFTFEIALAEDSVKDGIQLPDEKQKKNAADGKVNFGDITFTKTGVYQVNIKEVIPAEKVSGMVYDEHTCVITYTVADLNGQLVAGVSKIEGKSKDGTVYPSDGNQNWSNFTNVYTPNAVTAAGPKVKKTVVKDGAPEASPKADAYTFKLELASNNSADVTLPASLTAKNNETGEVSFGSITFAKEGTYIFHITEEIPADTAKVPGMTYDNHTCVVVYTVTRNMATGNLDVSVTSNNGTFTNTLSTGSLAITKQVAGTDDTARGESFTFTVGLKNGDTALDGEYSCEIAPGAGSSALAGNGKIKDGGTITLQHGQTATISGLPAGTAYTVTEDDYSGKGFTVEPSNRVQSGTILGGRNAVTFINTRSLVPAEAAITGSKTVDDKTPAGGEVFGFVLKPVAQGGVTPPMPTGAQEGQYTKYNVGGEIIFPTLTYNKAGSYYYTITENDPTIEVEKDPKTVWVRVAVTDAGKGELTAAVTYADSKDSAAKPDDSAFTAKTFTFANRSKSGSLTVRKIVLGNGADQSNTFTFTVTLEGTNLPAQLTCTTTDAGTGAAGTEQTLTVTNGKVTFTLKHGQTATISGLPTGTEYKVEEAEDKDYTTTSTGAEGRIARGEAASAVFYNVKKTTDGTLQLAGVKHVDGNAPASGESFSFTLRPTGSNAATAPMPAEHMTGTGANRVCTVQNSGASIDFGTISFTQDGTYTYEIRENALAGEQAGRYIADAGVVKVTVTASDLTHDGQRNVVAAYTKDDKVVGGISFENYSTGSLSVGKTVTNAAGAAAPAEQEFTFEVAITNLPAAVKGPFSYTVTQTAGGTTQSNTLTLNGGRAELKLKAGQTATITGLPAGAGYTVTETNIPSGFTASDGGVKSGTIAKNGAAKADITNTYNPRSATVVPSITKVLSVPEGSDRALRANEFEFSMSLKSGSAGSGGIEMPETLTAHNAVDGTVAFEAITFTKAGTYTVEVKETQPQQKEPNITYSTETIEITYTVKDEGGQLKVTPKSEIINGGARKPGNTITNSYVPTQISAEVPPVTKILEGRPLKDGEFTFTMEKGVCTDAAAIILPDPAEAVSRADGTVNFGDITFTKTGTYQVVIREKIPAPQEKGMSYDRHTCVITYTVADLNGRLVAGVSAITGTGSTTTTPDGRPNWTNFTNRYLPGSVASDGPVVKKVVKTDAGEGAPAADAYSFRMELFSNNADQVKLPGAAAAGETVLTAKNAADGTVTFGQIEFLKEGTYIFHIKEEIPADADRVPGMTYDGHTGVAVYTVEKSAETGNLTVSSNVTEETFTNTVSTGSLAITKQVAGTDTSAQQKEFSFTVGLKNGGKALTGEYSCEITPAGGSSAAGNGKIKDGGTITLKHGQTAILSGLPAGTEYTVKEEDYSAKGFSAEPASGEQSGTISGGTNEVTFINTRDLTPATAEISAKKTVDGKDPAGGELFGFVLKPVEQSGVTTPMPTGAQKGQYTKYNVGGDIIFPTLTYDTIGTYYYTITENTPTIAVEKDPKTVWVKVAVADTADNGTLTADVTYAETGDGANRPADTAFKADVPVFANKSQSGSLSIRKNVYGTGADTAKEFTFTVALTGTNLPAEVACTKTGAGVTGAAENLTVTDGKVTFTLKHGQTATLSALPAGTGYTVEETADADYTATSTGSKGTIRRGQTSSAVFYNAKKTADGTFWLHGVKYLDGAEPTTEKFTFILKPTGDNAETAPMPAGTTTGTGSGRICTVQNDGASIDFGELNFTEDGEYTYTISEQSKNGFVIDENDVTLKLVAFTENGQRNVSVTCTKSGVEFPNGLFVFDNYSTGSLSVSKKVTAEAGKEAPKDTLFHFQVNLTDSFGNPVAGEFTYEMTGAGSAAADGRLESGGKLTLKDGETATLSGLPTGTQYTVTEVDIPAGFVPEEEIISGAVERGETAEAAFANRYAPEAKIVRPQIQKILTVSGGGERPLRANEFGFEMKLISNSNTDGSGIVMPAALTARNNQNGTVTFQPIRFTGEGTYAVEISETVPQTAKVPGVTYSNDTVTIIYEVKDVDGVLQVTPDGSAPAGTITNTYEPKSISAEVPPIKKILNGKDLKDGMFTFTMELAPGSRTDGIKLPDAENGVSSAKNSAGGSVNFEDIEFTQTGTYVVDVKETKGTDPQMTYDGHTCRITYTVTDDNGQLKAGVSKMEYAGRPDESQNASIFINEYAPQAVTAAMPKLTKTLTGREKPLAADEFEFKAEVISGAEGGVNLPANAKNRADGSVQFGDITFRKAGTYVIRISEVAGSAKGITYDTANKYVLSYVVKNSDGALTVAAPVVVSGSDTFENVFTPEAATVKPTVKKRLNGRELKAREFSFTIALASASDRDGITLPLNRVAWNDADGNVEFDAIRFTKTGTYTVTVYEQKGNVPGVTYTDGTVTLTYTVTDADQDGVLEIASAADPADAAFVNTYVPMSTVGVVPVIRKVLDDPAGTGRTLQAGEFTFTMSVEGDADGYILPEKEQQMTAVNDADGSVEFGNIEFTKAGTYVVSIREQKDEDARITCDEHVCRITYVVTDEDGHLQRTRAIEGDIIYTNTYTPAPATAAAPAVRKVLSGERALKEGDFTFHMELEQGDSTGITLPANAKNEADGSVRFGDITFTKAGVYVVGVSEATGAELGVQYDPKVYEIIYEVTDKNGALEAAATIPADGIVFTNTYDPGTAQAGVPLITKVLEGGQLKPEQFTFTLGLAEGSAADGIRLPAATAKNSANGTVTFGDISFTKAGVYKVEIREQVPQDKGTILYDEHVCTVTYTVTDAEGWLKVTRSIDGATTFTNTDTYRPDAAVVAAPEITKQLTGRELKEGEFTFRMVRAAGNSSGIQFSKETAVNGADGKVDFGSITFTAAGTYIVSVSEVKGSDPGITYDATTYALRYVVTDENGKLSVQQSVVGGDAVFKNTYTPKKAAVELTGEKIVNDGEETEAYTGKFTFTLTPLSDGAPMPDVATATNAADGTFTFHEIEFETAGTWYYTITETGNRAPGVTSDEGAVYVNVTVKASEPDGELQAAVTYEKRGAGEGCQFINTYAPTPVTVGQLKAHKTVEYVGAAYEMTGGEFEFQILPGRSNPLGDPIGMNVVTNDANGEILLTDGPVTYTMPGTYRYVVEELSDGEELVPGMTYDTNSYVILVNVTDDGSGNLTAEVTGDDITFTNIYSPDAAVVVLGGRKNLTDGEGNALNLKGGEFTFVLEEGATSSHVLRQLLPAMDETEETGVVPDEPTIIFEYDTEDMTDETAAETSAESLTEAETQTETGTEDAATDETGAEASEEITETQTGAELSEEMTEAQTAAEAQAEAAEAQTSVTEEAQTEAAEAQTAAAEEPFTETDAEEQIVAYQVLESGEAHMIRGRRTGRTTAEDMPEDGVVLLSEEGFENGLVAVAVDAPMPVAVTAKNDASGNFRFGAITFEEAGEYTYRIREVNEGKDGYIYDGAVYDVTVKVEDQNGALRATEIVVSDSADPEKKSVIFNNQYEPDPAVYRLEGQKWLQGGSLREKEFTFSLFDHRTKESTEAQNDGDGAFAFDLSFAAAGTYYYTVHEKDTAEPGVTYDDSRYTAAIRVTDDGEGSLQVTGVDVTKQATGEKADRITFTNTYKAPVAPITIAGPRARKELKGRALQAEEFTFELQSIGLMNEIGSTEETVTAENDEEGNVEFPQMTFESAGEYYYMISEQPGSLPDVTYDTAYYVAGVTVTETDGELEARITYWNQAGRQVAERDVVFQNTYTKEAEPESAEVIRKSHGEKQYRIGDEVTFTITVKNAYSRPMKVQILEQQGVTITGPAEFEDVAPGSSVTATAVYTITAEDVKKGSFTNTATAKLVGEDGEEHSFQAEDTAENILQDYSYIVKYVNKDSGEEIHGQSEPKDAKFGAVIDGGAEAIEIEGYTFAEAADLTVSENADANVVTVYYQADFGNVKAEGFDVVYDGQTHTVTVSGTIPGDVVTFHDKAGAVRAADDDSQAPSIRNVRESIEEVVVSVMRGGSVHEMTVPAIIRKRPVTLASADLSKKYDGTPLTNGDTALAQDGYQNVEKDTGWVTGEGADLAFVGSQTEVGSSPNNFTCAPKEGTDFGNYEIKSVYGTLTVSQADEPSTEPSTEPTEPSTEPPAEDANCSITVTKSNVNASDGHLLGLKDATFYAMVFADVQMTQPMCDPLELSFAMDTAVSSITLEGLTPGTYYVAEVDASGNVVKNGTFEDGVYAAHYIADRQSVTVSAANREVEFAFENQFLTLPDEKYYRDLGLPEGETEPETETETEEPETESESEVGSGSGTGGLTGGGSGAGNGTAAQTSANPAQTGDETPILPMFLLMLFSAGVLLAAARRRREAGGR